MRTMQQWFDEYGESHKNKINKAFHWVCVPVIFFTIIGLLSTIPLPFIGYNGNNSTYLHIGSLLVALGLIFYARISIPMFIGMAVFSYFVLFINKRVGQSIEFNYAYFNLILFALAWIGQFIGHKIEGKKPSFLKDLQFLLIGPAWLMGFIYRKLGLKY